VTLPTLIRWDAMPDGRFHASAGPIAGAAD